MGIIVTILATLGVYGFFSGNFIFVIIGGIAALIETSMGIYSGQLRHLSLDIIAAAIGIIYSSGQGLPFWFGILIGSCFLSAISGIIGWLLYALVLIHKLLYSKNSSGF